MKKQLIYKPLLCAILFIFASLTAVSQNYQASQTISKNMSVSADVILKLSNHSGDIDISTNNNNNVSIQTDVKVNAKTKEDADKLMKAIESFDFDLNGKVLSVDTRFYKNMQTNNSRTTMTLNNGEKIRIKDFSISHKMSIPKSAALNLQNKYSSVTLETINGSTKLNLYSSKLFALDFGNNLKIEAKYSKLKGSDLKKDAELILYDTDFEFQECRSLNINSKYSKIKMLRADHVTADSYDDKFTFFDKLNFLKINAKYSDLTVEKNVNELDLELYDCNVIINTANRCNFSGKYSMFDFQSVKEIKIDDSYDNDIYLGVVETVDVGKSKYSKFGMKELSKFSIDDSYDDNLVTHNLNADFSGISLNGKYSKLEIKAGSVPFKIDVNMKYGKVDFPESMKPTKHIEKNGQIEIEAGTNGSTIKVEGYDNTVVIK